jgi:hypothetical protein
MSAEGEINPYVWATVDDHDLGHRVPQLQPSNRHRWPSPERAEKKGLNAVASIEVVQLGSFLVGQHHSESDGYFVECRWVSC